MSGQFRLSLSKKLIQPGHLRVKGLSLSQLELKLGNPVLKSGYDRNLVPVETPMLVEQGKGVHQLLRSKEKVSIKWGKEIKINSPWSEVGPMQQSYPQRECTQWYFSLSNRPGLKPVLHP